MSVISTIEDFRKSYPAPKEARSGMEPIEQVRDWFRWGRKEGLRYVLVQPELSGIATVHIHDGPISAAAELLREIQTAEPGSLEVEHGGQTAGHLVVHWIIRQGAASFRATITVWEETPAR